MCDTIIGYIVKNNYGKNIKKSQVSMLQKYAMVVA